jgi:hypothetical protein
MSKYNTIFIKPGDNYAMRTTTTATYPRICNARAVTDCILGATTTITSTSSFWKNGIAVNKRVRCLTTPAAIPSGAYITAIPTEYSIVLSVVPNTPLVGQTLVIDYEGGLYPLAPLRPETEDDAGPMENILTPDSNAPFIVAGPTIDTTVTVDIDLGADRNVGSVGLVGGERSGGTPNLNLVYSRTNAQGYAATGWTLFNPVGPSVNGNQIIWPSGGQGSTVAMRYLRIIFKNTDSATRWSVGRVVGATLPSVVDYLYGPNTKPLRIPARLIVTTADGRPRVTEMGSTRTGWSLVFPVLDYANMVIWRTLGDSLYPYLWLDGVEAQWHEVIATGPAEVTHTFGITGDDAYASDKFAVNLQIVSVR